MKQILSRIHSRQCSFKSRKKTGVFALIIVIFILSNPNPVHAVNMESPAFRIQGGNVNIGSGDTSSEGYNVSTTIGQLAAGEFQSTGYVIKAGFQYIHSIIPFNFSVSNTNINLGLLTPNKPNTAATTLTVNFGSSGQYQVTTSSDGPLETQQGATIENTKCSGDKNICLENKAAPWTSNNVYGFGYSLKGVDIPADFVDATYFRPFPNRLIDKQAVVIMSNSNVGKNRQATVTIKANVAPQQESGSYQTVVNFVATPSF